MIDDGARLRRLERELRAATDRRRLAEAQLFGILSGGVASLGIVLAFSIASDWAGLMVAVACVAVGQCVAAVIARRVAGSET